MWKRHKLRRRITNLRTTMATGAALVLYWKRQHPFAMREAIATLNPDLIPEGQRPKGTGGKKQQSWRVNYYEIMPDGTPVGWRSFDKNLLIGWAEWELEIKESEI